MTEQEWLACNDLIPLLESLPDKAKERKLRLFGCACARRVWHFLDDERSRQAVEVAERFADGQATVTEAAAAGWTAMQASRSFGFGRTRATGAGEAVATLRAFVTGEEVSTGYLAARMASRRARNAISTERGDADPTGGWDPAERELIPLLRDILGNPFRPVTTQPAWLSWSDGAVVKLAQAAYEERSLPSGELDPARLAVLADALEEAGCDHQDLLDHLRGPGPHVRGCWVVDLLLGRE
jgi:hypothetical protein